MVPANRNDRLRSLRVRSTEPDSTNGRECEVVRSLEKTGSWRELNDSTLATARSAKYGTVTASLSLREADGKPRGHARSAWATEPRQRSPEKVKKKQKNNP